MQWEGVTSAEFFPKSHTCNLRMKDLKQTQIKELPTKYLTSVLKNCQGCEKQDKTEKSVTDWRRLRRHGDYIQCSVQDGTLKPKGDINMKPGKIQKKTGQVNSIVPMLISWF